MANSDKIVKIKGVIKHYDWGGKTFLPSLCHLSNTAGKPYAEYWMGSNLHEGFGKLSYLFKVLDVEKMLSIQVHPTREVAMVKFEEENKKNIPVTAANRNYKDDNHKPELLSPLSDFYLLHGFKPADQMQKILKDVPELNFLSSGFETDNYRKLYTSVMTLPQEEVNKRLNPLLKRIIPLYESGKLVKTDEHFWAARAALTFNTNGNIDRGIFSIYFFNVLKMEEGQALFQDAGLPHAYLEGQTMEIMANSDNVLRGGLTPKHIDVPELLEQIRFEPTVPQVILKSTSDTQEEIFTTPAPDFQMSRIVIRPGQGISMPSTTTDVYFVFKGHITASVDDARLELSAGEAFLAVAESVVHLGSTEQAIIFRATRGMQDIE